MPEIFAPEGSLGSSDPGGVSTRWSKGCRKSRRKNFPVTGCCDGSCGSREAL